jgi:peptidoglycan-associated lipoprotein
MHNLRQRLFSSLITLSLVSSVTLTGCSWFKKGSGEGDGSELSESDLSAQRDGRFGSGSIPSAEGSGLFRDVPFGYDSYAIEDDARTAIEANAQTLKDNSDMKVTVEGHCDERGTVEYNMALGAERARATKNALVALGIPSSRINTISYGEEIPLDPGHNESAYSRNRRAHLSTGQDAPQAALETGDTTRY